RVSSREHVSTSSKPRPPRRSSPAVRSCAGPWRRRVRVISGRVGFRGRLEPQSIEIDETGQIAAIKKVLRSDDEIDHGDSLILPRCVDLHVHMRDPALRHKEDFPSGTRSAAIGGVATGADMPNRVPAGTTALALHYEATALRGGATV